MPSILIELEEYEKLKRDLKYYQEIGEYLAELVSRAHIEIENYKAQNDPCEDTWRILKIT